MFIHFKNKIICYKYNKNEYLYFIKNKNNYNSNYI